VSNSAQAILINGRPFEVPPNCTVEQLLQLLEMGERRVAVALNRDVIPRSHFGQRAISAGDRIEILEAVGGG
jgi:thiamine biosynthesis protein ThiS